MPNGITSKQIVIVINLYASTICVDFLETVFHKLSNQVS